MPQQNKYVIIREDLVQDPVTIISDGLLIGRLVECELLLNHPAVSRAQAGIKEINGTYFLFGLRPSNPVKLNGKSVVGNEALSPGDILEVGPFLLNIELNQDALVINVSLQIGRVADLSNVSSPDLGTAKLLALESIGESKKTKTPRAAPLPGDKALDIFWDKRIREAGKMVRPSPLFPKSQRRSGKAQFAWTPTTDLLTRWPVSFLIWGVIAVGLLSVAAAYWYTSAYAPGPVSRAHTKSKPELSPPIAVRANANECTSCHSFRGNMEANCAGCHTAEAFVATVTSPHVAAGVGCVSCHDEHRGTNFDPAVAALGACSTCHNDANRKVYNGRRVGTPHGGTFGYPVVNGKWKWKGLNETDWALKRISITRLPDETEEEWRRGQFHALHVHRVRAVAGIKPNEDGELSCSSCHKTLQPIDRAMPRTTCAACHSGGVQETNRNFIAADTPNCNSCHVEHVKDKRHWNPSLMVTAR
jgi:pSer/pThr/pTyr-binding forkhead associated (FHA) protein